jgi:hypothetical protein
MSNPNPAAPQPETCGWLVTVATGHPEPDFPGDLWVEVACGAKVKQLANGWECANGHGLSDYDSPEGQMEMLEAEYNDRMNGW